MRLTGAEAIVESLESVGVKHIFGIPGTQNLELFDCLISASIRNILVTNESSALFMADGYSRITGKPAICLSIPGPGLTNMFTGLAEAFLDSSPLLVLVAGIEESNKSFHIHQIKQLEAAKPIVKAIIKVNIINEISEAIYNAFFLSQQEEPGPVIIEIPQNFLKEKEDFKKFDGEFIKSHQVANEDTENIKQVVHMIVNAKHCGIYAGRGAFEAQEEIRQLSELISAPVTTTIAGRGVIPEDHPLSIGFGFGHSGSKISETIFKKCDVVIAVGCKFSEMATGGWGLRMPENLIHIDKNKDVFNKNYKAKICLCMDAKIALQKMLGLMKAAGRLKNRDSELIEKIHRAKKKYLEGMDKTKLSDGVRPAKLFYELRKLLKRDAVLVTDCGNHQLWAISDFSVLEPRTFITPTDYQAMGFGIPAAIGVKFAFPDRDVICVCGDGGFLMSGFEILTAVKNKLKLTIIIFNDDALGLIKGLQRRIYGRLSSVDILNPDYKDLARAFGLEYIEIGHDEEVVKKISEALLKEKTVLVNVKINYAELPGYIKSAWITTWRNLSLCDKLKVVGKRTARYLKYDLKNISKNA